MRLLYRSFLVVITILITFSGCSIQSDSSAQIDFINVVHEYAASYSYTIAEETDTEYMYSAELESDAFNIELQINKGNDKQYNSFELICENSCSSGTQYDEVMILVNSISRKSFDAAFVSNIIENEDRYYNCSEYYTSDAYLQYVSCKIDCLDLAQDYCFQYVLYQDNSQVVSIGGFTK